jgi:hypothetical protein
VALTIPRLLRPLFRTRREISQDLAHELVAWRHPRFSSHVAETIDIRDVVRVPVDEEGREIESSPPERLSDTLASPHKGRGVCGQGTHDDHTPQGETRS